MLFHFYKVDQEITNSFEGCFDDTLEKCHENVTLGTELNMGLKDSPPELFIDDKGALMEMSEEAHGWEFGNLLPSLDYGWILP